MHFRTGRANSLLAFHEMLHQFLHQSMRNLLTVETIQLKQTQLKHEPHDLGYVTDAALEPSLCRFPIYTLSEALFRESEGRRM
jgi:hypothetical protein